MISDTALFGFFILAIDIPWIYYVMSGFYNEMFSKFKLSLKMNMLSAMVAYTIMILSFPLIIYDKNREKMIKKAAIIGFIAYGIYGFTLSAVFPGYPVKLAIMETLWGTTLYTVSAFLTSFFGQRMLK